MIMFCNANRCDTVLLNIYVMYYVECESKKINKYYKEKGKSKRLLFVLLILVELVVTDFYTCTLFS